MNRRQAISASLGGLSAIAAAVWFLRHREDSIDIRGIVWQVDNATVDIDGDWQRLGVRELLVQWSVVDELAFIPGTGLPLAARLPDWQRIAHRPWAREVIMGLAGRFREQEARSRIDRLADISRTIASLPTPLNISGWYFPVEVDPTWQDAPHMTSLLARLPAPLWISVYDSANIGAKLLADWLASWLPANVGVFFQDGVGVYAREPSVARIYADALAEKLGRGRLRVIVEAFRAEGAGGFRAARLEELVPQVLAMKGHELYLYDGPHYIDTRLVDGLAKTIGRPAGSS